MKAGMIAGVLGVAAVLSLVNGCACPMKGYCCASARAKSSITFDNASFYDKSGQFNAEKAKDAVMALAAYHGYPIFPGMREKLWVSDYGKGQFTKLGLAAIMFTNNEADRYMLQELFLLPGQMLPEHWHVEGTKNPAKREGWVVRNGLSHIVGEGDPNLGPTVVVPACHMNGTVTVRHEVVTEPGSFVPLSRVLSHHWQLAGSEGAIITEVANVHSNEAVRHLDPAINDFFLGKK